MHLALLVPSPKHSPFPLRGQRTGSTEHSDTAGTESHSEAGRQLLLLDFLPAKIKAGSGSYPNSSKSIL